ncbi:hypothetical protein [Streptomyces lincolnensis]|uniref:hypothetical protein n=1 Tax=Streptomyces lincolnensis TaxID=1915 RepID=UPI0037D5F08B
MRPISTAATAPHQLLSTLRNTSLPGTRVMIGAMPLEIVPADVSDLGQVLEDHARSWGEWDLRAPHQPVLLREFGATCMVARDGRPMVVLTRSL